MAVTRSVQIDVELETVGQRDQTERYETKLAVSRDPDGRVRIGRATQSGFQAILFDWDDLLQAVDGLEG